MIVMSCLLFPSSAAAAGSVPTVSLTGISPDATVAGTVNLGATASGDNGVTQVKWYVDNVEVGWDGSSSWTAAWDSRKVSDGVHSVLAKAADSQGNWGVSAIVSFAVKNYVPPPTSVAVTLPAANTTVSGTVSLTASASDSDASGIAELKWYVDDVESGWDGSSPWQVSWKSWQVSNGTHSVIARALTGDGTWLTSAVTYFTVANGTTTPPPPPPPSSKWQLAASDDFNAATLDLSKWKVYGPNWTGNAGNGLRDGRAVSMQNGTLTITRADAQRRAGLRRRAESHRPALRPLRVPRAHRCRPVGRDDRRRADLADVRELAVGG